MHDDRRDPDVAWFMPAGSPCRPGFCVVQESDHGVCIQEVLHDPKSFSISGRSVACGRSFTAFTKSSSRVPAIASSQLHVSGTGSRMTPFPRVLMRTSRASTRNCFATLTACDRAEQKPLAVSMAASVRYANEI